MRILCFLFVVVVLVSFAAGYFRVTGTVVIVGLLVWWFQILAVEEEYLELPNKLEVIRVYEDGINRVADRINVDVVSAGHVFRDSNADYYYRMDFFYREGALAQSGNNKFVHLYSIENSFAQAVLTNQFLDKE